jgi:hypothetical protein
MTTSDPKPHCQDFENCGCCADDPFPPFRTPSRTNVRDGAGQPTLSVRELKEFLSALPDDVQDLPVTIYCDDGISGINYERGYRNDEWESRINHVKFW